MIDFFIDIGNTRIKYTQNRQPFDVCFTTHNQLAPIFAALRASQARQLLIAAGSSKSAQMAKTNLIAFAATHSIATDVVTVRPDWLPVNYADTSQFGADRFLNLLAATNNHKGNVCVISAGTAITLDFFTHQHLGGMILLGLGSTKAILAEKTGLSAIIKPTQSLGHDTASTIGAGIYLGLQNLIDRSIERLEAEHRCEFHRLWTGGDATAILTHGEYHPTLLFEGMVHYRRLSL